MHPCEIVSRFQLFFDLPADMLQWPNQAICFISSVFSGIMVLA